MVLGMASVVLFNIIDTFFVARLGPAELAAMSFTFPVVFTVMSLSLGLSVAATSVISRAIGRGDTAQVRRLTTHALALANSVVAIFCVAGLLTIDPLFAALGAGEEIRPLIRQYMVPWYIGVGFLVIPMVGNGAIRATGDTKTPSYLMIFSGLLNAIIDPLLIFGLGPFPRLELQGAAIATIISRSMTLVAAVWILHHRDKMLDLSLPRPAVLWDSWRQFLFIGAPAAGAKMLMPLSTGVLTRMVSSHGAFAVAAFGVAQRLEALAMIGVGALGAAVSPFIGQNYGAKNLQRVRQAFRFVVAVALGLGLALAILLGIFARPLILLFNDQPDVVHTASWFLWLVPASYGLFGAAMMTIEAFNAINRPLRAVVVIFVRLFVLAIPLAWAGDMVWGLPGIFAGISAGNMLIGVGSYAATRRFLSGLGA